MKLLTGNFLHSWYTGKLGQTRGGFREESPRCMITVGHSNFNSTLCNFWKGQDWAGKKIVPQILPGFFPPPGKKTLEQNKHFSYITI